MKYLWCIVNITVTCIYICEFTKRWQRKTYEHAINPSTNSWHRHGLQQRAMAEIYEVCKSWKDIYIGRHCFIKEMIMLHIIVGEISAAGICQDAQSFINF